MQASAKEVVKVIVISIAAMLTLPVAYRIWTAYHPQPECPRRTLTQLFEQSAADNAQRLLKTPLAKWTEGAKKAEPKIFAWLVAHEKTVLPWEWTEEARRKDPEGHRKLWGALFEEQVSALKSRLRSERGGLMALECKNWIADIFHSQRTNQSDRVRAKQAVQGSVKALSESLEDAEKTLGLLEKPEGMDDDGCEKMICRLINVLETQD